jgi:hypothetical protein
MLIRPKANMTDVDLTDYKLLKKSEFVFNPKQAPPWFNGPVCGAVEGIRTEIFRISPKFRQSPQNKHSGWPAPSFSPPQAPFFHETLHSSC